MSKFRDRRMRKPDYSIVAYINGIRIPDGKVDWDVEIDGEDDKETAAGILERAAEVLRDEP